MGFPINITSPTNAAPSRRLCSVLVILAFAGIVTVATAQTRTLRIVQYNIQADVNGSTTPTAGLINPFTGTGGNFTTNSPGSVTNGGVLEAIGEETIGGDVAQPLDILALEETTSNSRTVQPIVDGLNAFYSVHTNAARYAMSPYQATESGNNPSTGNGPNALVYNTNTVQLVASVPVDPPGGTSQLGSASGEYREVMRYEFAPAGVVPTTNNEFYIYVSHYKASSGAANDASRHGEAIIIRNDEANNLPATARVLYVGDYNVDDNSAELGYQTILSNAAPNGIHQGQGIDPLNLTASTTINWSSSTTDSNILAMLSEESYTVRYRDDLQVMTSNVYYHVAGGLQYVPGTYHTFGNNGTIPYNSSVVNGANTALNGVPSSGVTIPRAQVYNDLTGGSDHLPIVVDYIVPLDAAPPVASFTATPTNGPAPLTVTFTDTSTGTITNRFWNFGDGTTTNIAALGITHTYAVGTNTVTLITAGYNSISTNIQPNLIIAVVPTIYTVATSPSPAPDGTTGGDGSYTNGTAATVTATANSCFLFVNWTENASIVSTSPHYTFTVTTNRTLVANFTSTFSYTINTASSPAGGGSTSGGGIVACASNATVCATANSCYTFVNWTDQYTNVVSVSACYNFPPNGNDSLTAHFILITNSITTAANPLDGGSTTGDGPVTCGSNVTVCAISTPCDSFVNWTVNSSVVSTSPCYTFTASGDENLVANFAAISYGGPNGGNLTTLHPFNYYDGAYPPTGVILGNDGNFYGTTSSGGSYGYGTAFRISSSGAYTNLYSFSSVDGSPYAALLQASDGNFYGTTYNGGSNSDGTVFRLSPGGSLTNLYSFSYTDGADPFGTLVQGLDGNLYGTTEVGGTSGYGTVFRITLGGNLATLHSFNFTDGGYPIGGLALGSDTNFYGTTYYGGPGVSGTVFRISSSGAFSSLHSFSGPDGSYPFSNLIQGNDGNFYGTTLQGGTFSLGTVFRITPGGSVSNLWSFSGCSDSAYPQGTLLQGNDGNLYGTTTGSGSGTSLYGTVFRIGLGGNFTNLWAFGSFDGASPYATLVQGNDGALYGTTSTDGGYGYGTIFRIDVGLCGYELTPNSTDVNSTGSTGTITLTAVGTSCVWTGVSNSSFINITSASGGTGSGSISYTVAADTATNTFGRVGTMTIGGRTFTVSQAGPGCSFTLDSTNASFTAAAASGIVNVNVNGQLCAWTATSNSGFITITSGAGSSGNGTVNYSIAANTNSFPLTGTMTIAGQTFTVTQGASGCSAVLTVGSSPAAGGITSGGGAVGCGSNVAACATANACYNFVNWTVNGNAASSSACSTFAVLSNETLVANFAPIFYTINATGSPVVGGSVSGGGPAACGSNVTICATPNSCYSFVNWTDLNNHPISTLACYTFTPTTSTNVVAHFAPASPYTISTASSPAAGGSTSGAGTVACGSNVTVCATPNSCYGFVNWIDQNSNIVSTSACYNFTAFGAQTLTANFAANSATSGASLTNLWSFTNGRDGAFSQAALMQASDGNLYGTTFGSGSGLSPYGNVFRISTNGVLTNLWSFTNGSDGANSYASLVQGMDGNFYGATSGSGSGPSANGNVFRITPGSSLTNLHSFNGSDGAAPSAGLVRGSDGNFYGTTYQGGANGYGTVFRITSTGSLSTLWNFANGLDGANSYATLAQGGDGNFYGTTSGSGSGPAPNGTVFRITPSGSLTNLWEFTGCSDGGYPYAGLVQGSDGNFYGATSGSGSGPSANGSVFRITSGGTLTALHSFGGSDGANPYASLVQGSDGNFYGTSYDGGASGHGSVFQLLVSLNPPANQISSIQRAASNIVVTVPSVAGETYQLQYCSSLTLTNWSNIAGASMTNSMGGLLSLTNLGGALQPQGFYRFDITP